MNNSLFDFMKQVALHTNQPVKIIQKTEIDINCDACTANIHSIEINYKARNTELLFKNECNYCPKCGRKIKT